jgi:hypothetical protein
MSSGEAESKIQNLSNQKGEKKKGRQNQQPTNETAKTQTKKKENRRTTKNHRLDIIIFP